MHELAITEQIIEEILLECDDRMINTVQKIVLELGALTNYKKDAILFYFDSAKGNIDPLKSCELDIIDICGKVRCNECGKTGEIDDVQLIFCPSCKSMNIDIVDGKDIILKEIEGK